MRHFTVVDVKVGTKHKKSLEGGRYNSNTTPISAAKKAFTQVCRGLKLTGKCAAIITLQETTRDSNKKTFRYRLKRVEDPRTVIRNGQEITYKYKTQAKAY